MFNQGKELVRCLRALEAQAAATIHYEVIVVDNASDKPVGPLTEPFGFVRCIRESKPGSYAARNRGVEASRGRLLAFTDADCVPSDTWIERGVAALHRLPGFGMVGGRIDLTVAEANAPTSVELYDSLCGFPQEAFIEAGFSATANLFTTRATFDRVGPFDESLMSGGDMEWGQRLRGLGFAQAYADDVRVSHPARRTVGQLYRKILRIAAGNQQLAEQRGEGTAGLRDYAWKELVLLRRTRQQLADERLGTVGRKIRFGAVVWLVDVLRTVERYRIHFGGTPRRT